MISVIIPLYNKEHSIARAIHSVINQSLGNFELLIINDGSTDNSVDEVEKIKDARIKLIHQENKGVSAARNKGIREANFKYLAFLDGDDWWHKDFLLTLSKLISDFPDSGIYAGRYTYIKGGQESIEQSKFPNINRGFFNLNETLHAISSSSIIVDKKCFYKYGSFDENLTHGEDTDMWIRIGMNEKMCFDNKQISFVDLSSNPLSRSIGKKPKIKNHLISKIDNYIGINNEWDFTLIKRKADYLFNFYIDYPNNKMIKMMIKSLPDYIFEEKRFLILKLPIGFMYVFKIMRKLRWQIFILKNKNNL